MAYSLTACSSLLASSGEERQAVGSSLSESQTWKRAIRGYRSDHNFSLGLGRTIGTWRQFRAGSVELRDIKTTANTAEFSYSFHLPWVGGLGYSLGSRLGWVGSETRRDALSSLYSLSLPGLDLGLVWNMSEQFRVSVEYSYAWVRVEGLRFGNAEDRSKASVTADMKTWRFILDTFFELPTALRLEIERYEQGYSSSGRLDLQKIGISVKLGCLRHLI